MNQFRCVLLVLSGGLYLWPMAGIAADEDCKLTSQQKSSAVKAFNHLYPIFQDERCLNCHGGMNPFDPRTDHAGGWINIRKAARELLAKGPVAPRDLVTSSDESRSREIQELNQLAEGRDEDVISDKDLIRMKYTAAMRHACSSECHVDIWTLPLTRNSFAGRSAKQICVHMKTSLDPPTPDEFLQHMQEEEFNRLAFEGRRGLKTPINPEPPAMEFANMVRFANEWIEAMDAKFEPPPECGCEVDGIALEIRQRLYTDPASKHAKVGWAQFDGSVAFDIVLEREPGEGTVMYRGEMTVTRPLQVKHVVPSAVRCSGSGSREESWQITALPDSENKMMKLYLTSTDEGEEAGWTCTQPGHTTTSELYVDISDMIKTLDMPIAAGSVKEVSQRNSRAIEELKITVIDAP